MTPHFDDKGNIFYSLILYMVLPKLYDMYHDVPKAFKIVSSTPNTSSFVKNHVALFEFFKKYVYFCHKNLKPKI